MCVAVVELGNAKRHNMLSRSEAFIIINNRISVSHVGSLVLIDYLQKIEKKESYDKRALETCLTQSVAEAARLQA
jgi:hypothetical protein